jgi:4-aminobutyrate--pyruvate transaminase
MKPSSISIAKAVTSAYFPMAAITIEDELDQAMLDESRKIGTFGHGFTYTAHPVGCAVALKTIEIYERDRTMDHVRKVAPTFEKRIAQFADHPLVGETRARGLIGAIELVADKKTRRAFDPKTGVGAIAADILQDNGLIVRSMGDAIAFCPPLIIREGEIDEMFDIVGKGLRLLEERVLKENLREPGGGKT